MKSTCIIIVFFLSVLHYTQSWKHWKRPVCDPIKCEANCREVYNPRACPTCICDKVECAMPLCLPGCKLQTEFKGPCPECDCDVDKVKLEIQEPVCDPVKCLGNCREAKGPGGCPICVCDPQCSPPLCPPGCEIETDFVGPCPGCKCDRKEDEVFMDKDLTKALCDPIKCLPPCIEAKGLDGCPVCECRLCAPPKCPPGCEVEKEFDGPCPGCKCDKDVPDVIVDKDLTKALCDPVKCLPSCKEIVLDGCPKCDCPLCSPPICPPGCEIEKEFDGPCPGCKCDKEVPVIVDKDLTKALCDPVKCLPSCREIVLDGCPKCDCPLCSSPICPPGCEIEKEFDGLCPGCKCDKEVPVIVDKDLTKALCDPVKCLPSCKEVVLDGCPKCDCPLCSPPICPPGCEIEKEFDGPCPGCKCDKEVPELKKDCPPEVECLGSCKPEIDEDGCKKCVCKPECNIPLCKPGCFIKNRVGRCPYCHCPRWAKKD